MISQNILKIQNNDDVIYNKKSKNIIINVATVNFTDRQLPCNAHKINNWTPIVQINLVPNKY